MSGQSPTQDNGVPTHPPPAYTEVASPLLQGSPTSQSPEGHSHPKSPTQSLKQEHHDSHSQHSQHGYHSRSSSRTKQPRPIFAHLQQGLNTRGTDGQPPDYLLLSCLSCICLFFPVSVTAIIFAWIAKTANTRCDYTTARDAGKKALCLSIISMVLGAIMIITLAVLSAEFRDQIASLFRPKQ